MSNKKWHFASSGWLLVSMAIIIADQLSKWWVMQHLFPYQVQPITSFFNLVLAFNEGAAFSFLSQAGGWQRFALSGIALIVVGYLLLWLWQIGPKHNILKLSISLIIGGALGNLWDRVWYGHVVDFLDFHVAGWHWPAFNVADSAICMGVGLLIYLWFFVGEKTEKIT